MDIGTLVMKINADTANAEKNISGIQKTIGGFGKVIAGVTVAAGAVLVGALADGVKGMMEMEQQTAQLNAVLASTNGVAGVTAEEVTAMADAFEKSTKFAAESVLAGQNLLLTFTNIGKDVFPQATQAMVDMATAMGTDVSSQAIALGKALNDPVAGVASLTRVGVQFTDEQKNTISAMVEMGDVAGAQGVILKELETQFGGSAVAAGQTFAGQIEIAKNSLGEITESLAVGFMPVLQVMLEWVNNNMPMIQAILQTTFDAFSAVIGNVVEVFNAYFLPVLQQFADFIVDNWPVIQATIETVFGIIVSAGMEFWKFFGEKIMPIIGSFVDYIQSNWPTIQKTFETVFGIMSDAVQILWDIFTGLWDFLEPTFPLIGAAGEAAFNVVGTVIDGVIETIASFIAWIKDALDWLDKFLKKSAETGGLEGNAGSGHGLGGGYGIPTTIIPPGGLESQMVGQQQRAFGGAVMAGKSYLVGERGAETFTPKTNGSINPSSGNNVTININGSTNTDEIMHKVVRVLKQNKVIPV